MTRNEQIDIASLDWWMNEVNQNGDAEMAFKAGAAWADENPQNRWISVEEELPKCYKPCDDYMGNPTNFRESELCLVLTKSGKIFVATLNQNFDEEDGMPTGKPYWFDEHPEEASDGCWLDFDVTHWMPLPQPPKKGGER